MTISGKQLLLFSLAADIDWTLSTDEHTALDKIQSSDDLATAYLTLAQGMEEGVDEKDYDDICQTLNKTYSDFGVELEGLKEVFKQSIKEGEVDSIS